MISAVALLLFVCSGSAAMGQGFGTIVGTVTDSTGAALPHAQMTVVNEGTGQSRDVTPNAQGYFVVPSLNPAVYSITINAAGFAPFTRNNITVLADESLTLNATLSLRGETQQIVVESNPVEVDTTTSVLSQVVEQKRIVDLPLNGRNPVSLALLVPGATVGNSFSIDQGVTKTFPAAITISFNGSRANQTSYNLDGVNHNDIYTNVNMPFPFPDALQEFSVQTSNYSARYGGNSGAVVNAITRSGNNDLHGDVFEFIRNAVFNARNYFAPARDALKRNQFGGTVGGPIVIPRIFSGKDKSFFFFGYQQTQLRDVQNGNQAYVPTAAELSGDFSALLTASNPNNPFGKAYQIVDPNTKVPYAKNQIPVSQFDPAALAFTKYLPLAAADPGTGRVLYSIPLSQSFNEYMARADQTLTKDDHITARYYINRFDNAPFLDPTNYLVEVGPTRSYAHNALLSETHIFSPNVLNELRLSFSRTTTNSAPPPNSINLNTLGVNIWQPPGAPFIGTLTVNGYFGTPGTTFLIKIFRDNYNLADDFTYVHGQHSMVFGVLAVRGQNLIRDQFQAGGNFGFTSDSTNNALAGFLLGSVRTLAQGSGETKDDVDHLISLYAQDDYHVTTRLTVNVGLRWEPYIPWAETKGRVEQFRAENYYAGVKSRQFPNAPAGLIFPGDPGMPKNGVNSSYPIFGGRAGFALDVRGDGKTSLRGAVGSFHDSQQDAVATNRFVDVSPFDTVVSVTSPAGPFSNPYLGMTNPFPAPPVPSPNTVFPTPVLVVTYNPANNSVLKVPTTYNFNLTGEQQLRGGFLLRATYVGALSRNNYEGVELNPAVYTPGSTLSTDQRRAFAGYGSIAQYNTDAVSSYNALQLTAQRRMSRLTVLANYTYSKSLDDFPYGQANTNPNSSNNSALPYSSPLRHAFDYGPSDYDRRHIGIISYVYDLPDLAKRSAILRILAGGWETTGIIRTQSGAPFTVLAGSDRSQTGLGTDRGTYVTGANVHSSSGCVSGPCVPFLNQAAFVLPALGSAGNVGKNSLTGPILTNWDVGVLKSFPFEENRFRFQFHAEFFNVLNKTNLNNPISSVSSAGFGTITSAADPRIGQLAVKFIF